MTTNEKFPVEIPACFIKDKAIDYDMELFSSIGGSLQAFGRNIKAPSLGVFCLLETFESKFIANREDCSIIDIMRVVYVNHHRAACVQEVMDWAYPDKGTSFNPDDKSTWKPFDWNVVADCEDMFEQEIHETERDFLSLVKWFDIAFEGFDMIPSSGSSTGVMWFGSDAVGALAHALNRPLDEVLWELPMCHVGHFVAAACKFNGNEHVKRKKDVEDFKLKTEEARERVRNGELHPWQLQDPTNPAWPLTQKQIEFAPNLEDEWNKLVEEKTNVKR